MRGRVSLALGAVGALLVGVAALDLFLTVFEPVQAYERYREWFPFTYRQRVILSRVASALGYETPTGGTAV